MSDKHREATHNGISTVRFEASALTLFRIAELSIAIRPPQRRRLLGSQIPHLGRTLAARVGKRPMFGRAATMRPQSQVRNSRFRRLRSGENGAADENSHQVGSA